MKRHLLLIASCLLTMSSIVRAKAAPNFSGPLVDALTSRWQSPEVGSAVGLAPHARCIAVFAPPSSVMVYERGGKQIQVLTVPSLAALPGNLPANYKDVPSHLQWSADGTRLLLSTAMGAFVWREQTKNSPTSAHPSYELLWKAAAQNAVLSPDGGSVAYVLPTAETPARDPGYTLYVQRATSIQPLWKLFVGPLPMVAGQWPADPRGLLWTVFAPPLQTEFKAGVPVPHPSSPAMVVAWGAMTGQHEFQFEVPDADGKTLCFSGEGRNLIGSSYGNTAKALTGSGLFRWDLSDGSPHQIAPHREDAADAFASSVPPGLMGVAVRLPLLVMAQGNKGSLFRVADGTPQGFVLVPDSQVISGVTLAPDGDYLLLMGAPNSAMAKGTTFSLYHLRALS